MKKYIAILLCGAIILSLASCERGNEPEENNQANDIATFCNSLIGLSVEEADSRIRQKGFTVDPEASTFGRNIIFTANMGPYSSTAGFYAYHKDESYRDENGTIVYPAEGFETNMTVEWFDGVIKEISYKTHTAQGNLQTLALQTEQGLHTVAQQTGWDLQYFGYQGRASNRGEVMTAIKNHPQGYCTVSLLATDTDFSQSLCMNGTARGISYIQSLQVDSTRDYVWGYMQHYLAYGMKKDFRYIPQALYMPDVTIRVGEYLHKASTKILDDVIEETRVTYSTYNDEHPFQQMGRWEMGYYSCGMAFFAPAGAMDLEANKVTHTSSDESILKVEQDECQAGKEFYEKIRIRAVAPGEATLTVRWKDLSTTATITVIE